MFDLRFSILNLKLADRKYSGSQVSEVRSWALALLI